MTLTTVRDGRDIERELSSHATHSDVGLVVVPSSVFNANHKLIVNLAAQFRFPAVYPARHVVDAGGLMSYDVDVVHAFRQTARYVDRILRGDKPGDLPVQAASKFELVINLKTARALGLAVPPTLLARADEVIE